jgi:D-alanine-D-alanine ligase
MLDESGRPAVIEANAIPGLTDTSLLPMAAHAAGLEFEDLVARIVELAVSRTGVIGTSTGA